MGRCGSCRTQTQHFCFVHQEFVCDLCLIRKDSIHGRCVVNTYRKWVQDSSYDWPPKCAACKFELDAEGDNVRRTCLHVEHAACIEKSKAPDHTCSVCEAPLNQSFDTSQLGEALIGRVRQMQALSPLLPEPPKHEITEQPQTDVRVPSAEPLNPKFQRPSATLRVVETETGSSVSKVTAEDDRQGRQELRPAHRDSAQDFTAQSRRSVTAESSASMPRPAPAQVATILPEPPAQGSTETRIHIGMPPLKNSKSGNTGSSKRDKGSARMTSTLRRTIKTSRRRLFDLRKILMENRRRSIVVVVFMVCIVMSFYLSSGDDDNSLSSRPVVEDVTLPHIRVNPAFIKGQKESGLARIRGRVE